MRNLKFKPMTDNVHTYDVFSEDDMLLATLKKRTGEWFLWDLLPGVCLDRDSVKAISKKIKELNNGK